MKKFTRLLFAFLLVSITQSAFAQLSGIYRIGTTAIGGEVGSYASLAAAITDINTQGVNGPCTFYFSDNATTYTEAVDVALGCATASSINTITFKPYTGVTCTVEFTSNATRTIDGNFVIGAANAAGTLPGILISTNYVTIDGSNTNGGTTKDLTILGAAMSTTKSVFRILGNNDNVSIKNCIITNRSTSASSTAPINITNYFNSPTSYVPDNFLIENNTLNSILGNGSVGVQVSVSGAPTTGTTGIIIANNTIFARATRAIFFNYVTDGNIYGNTISLDNQLGTAAAAGIYLTTGFATPGTYNIYNNTFTKLATLNNVAGASNGIIGIDNALTSPKIVNIYNNVIRGFQTTAGVTNSKIYGIRQTSTSTTNIYNNSIYLPDLTNMTAFGGSYIAGVAFATATTVEVNGPSALANCTVISNTIYMDESSMKVYAIRRVGNTGTFRSDSNLLYINPANASAFIGHFNGVDRGFVDWQTDNDANGFNQNPSITSPTNLMPTLAGFYPGSTSLFSATDINGVTRSTTKPHIGAFESTAKHWLGTTADWATASNWRDNVVPSSGDDVIIGFASTNTAIPSSFAFDSLGLQPNTELTVGSNTLTANGSIVGTGNLLGSATSSLILNGPVAALKLANSTRILKDLTLGANASTTIPSDLEIVGGSTAGTVSIGASTTLTVNGNLLLKSDANGTAKISAIGAGGAFSATSVTTETFIPGGRRAFRFLGHPFSNALDMTSLKDDIFVSGTNGNSAGFDETTSNSPSSFWFNASTNSWVDFSPATDASWTQYAGTRILVRGDRTQTENLGATPSTPLAVTLDITGVVNTGNQNIAVSNAGNFHLVSNPYPSPTDIGTVIDATANIGTMYWVWDANAVSKGAYVPKTVGSGAYNLAMNGAFFVQPTVGTTLAFTEANKTATATANLYRTATASNQLEVQVNYNSGYADLLFVRNNATASTTKEATDGSKLSNPDVNIYAIASGNDQLTLDSRPIANNTIIPVGFTSTIQSNFEIALNSNTLNNGLDVIVKDKFLNVEHTLTASNPYSFAVTADAASQGENRFELVFRTSGALPTSFVTVSAAQQGNAIAVNFTTANEQNMSSYEVEESANGTNFAKGTSIKANNTTTANYNWLDVNINNGNNYYRIKAIEKNGVVKYSQVVNVRTGTKGAEFAVYPNPVKGGVVNVQLTNIEKGQYSIKIVNSIGQEVAAKTIVHNGGSATQSINIGNVASGTYNMVISNGTTSVTKTVIVE